MVLNFIWKTISFYFHWLIVFSFPAFVVVFVRLSELNLFQENEDFANQTFDYIIVGGGSAGAIVATRLSENDQFSVLLIEAGTKKPSFLNIPALGPLHQLSQYDWQYVTVPQKHACFGLTGNRSRWPAGKVLGGTTHLNYMLHVPGMKSDFLPWKDPDSQHWSYSDILYYFSKSVQDKDPEDEGFESAFLPLRPPLYTTGFSEAMFDAGAELGYPEGDDAGFHRPLLHLNSDGSRWTSDQFLDTARGRKNLKILTSATVQKITFINKFEASGVELDNGSGKRTRVAAAREVVVAAGTVGSAKLLLLSGVGPAKTLKEAKIPQYAELPVGENLQDHITTGPDLLHLPYHLLTPSSLTSPLSLASYYLRGRGPWCSALCEALALFPDLEFMFMMAGLVSDGGLFSRRSLGISDKVWKEYFAHFVETPTASILPVLLHPKSRGNIRLNPKNPEGHPRIDPNYLSHPHDVTKLIEAIRIIRRLSETSAALGFGTKFNKRRLPSCRRFKFDSDSYWECYIRHLTLTSYHPIGTCKMGSLGENGVVDYKLRVHKLNKLRVIDASVIPNLPSGNTNAAVLMIAEKGSDLIKEAAGESLGRCRSAEVFIREKICPDVTRRLEMVGSRLNRIGS